MYSSSLDSKKESVFAQKKFPLISHPFPFYKKCLVAILKLSSITSTLILKFHQDATKWELTK